MLNIFPYIPGRNCVTPDRILLPEREMDIPHHKVKNLAWTYLDGRLYVGRFPMVHPMMYGICKFKEMGLDGRLFLDERIVTFWWCSHDMAFGKKKILSWMPEMIGKLRAGDWEFIQHPHGTAEEPEPVDIGDWTVMFMGEVAGVPCIVECDMDTFLEGEGFELHDCTTLRFFRLGPGFLAPRPWSPPKPKTQYQLSCDYWKSRAGEMDVAEWHLLMYGE